MKKVKLREYSRIEYIVDKYVKIVNGQPIFKNLSYKKNKEDYENLKEQFSSSAIYHVAGDSIVTTCITSIFGTMCNVDYEKAISEYVETLKGDYE